MASSFFHLCGVSSFNCDRSVFCKFCFDFEIFLVTFKTRNNRSFHFTQIPESPLWLISKNRPEDAKKALSWLRGWVSPESIEKEFQELKDYREASSACASCAKQSIKCNHPGVTFFQRIKELKRKRSLKPFILIVSLQFFHEFSGMSVYMPYIIPGKFNFIQ